MPVATAVQVTVAHLLFASVPLPASIAATGSIWPAHAISTACTIVVAWAAFDGAINAGESAKAPAVEGGHVAHTVARARVDAFLDVAHFSLKAWHALALALLTFTRSVAFVTVRSDRTYLNLAMVTLEPSCAVARSNSVTRRMLDAVSHLRALVVQVVTAAGARGRLTTVPQVASDALASTLYLFV